jgi:stringent starvation protein B
MAVDGVSIPSTKPYLIRALHEWCSDNGFTPFIAVFVDGRVEVPMEFVKNDEIVLNLSSEACHQLDLGNEWVSFQARFGGVPKRVMVPVTHVLAIYARENGQGMSFPFDGAKNPDPSNTGEVASDAPKKPRPSLTIVK